MHCILYCITGKSEKIINRNEKGKKEEENEQQDKYDRVKDWEIINYSHKYTSLDRQSKFISH